MPCLMPCTHKGTASVRCLLPSWEAVHGEKQAILPHVWQFPYKGIANSRHLLPLSNCSELLSGLCRAVVGVLPCASQFLRPWPPFAPTEGSWEASPCAHQFLYEGIAGTKPLPSSTSTGGSWGGGPCLVLDISLMRKLPEKNLTSLGQEKAYNLCRNSILPICSGRP